jgi:tetratricopeptide (TPR) repeat protein
MNDTVARYKSLAAALLREPDNPEHLVDQFALLSGNGDRANGKHYLYLARRAYNAAPDSVNAAFNYGSALQRAGRFADAKEMYRWCVDHASADWLTRCLHHLGIAYRALGQNERAIEYYDQAISRDPDPQFRKDRALAKMANGWLREGLEEFECRRELAEQRLAANNGELIAQRRLPAGVRHLQGEDLAGKTLVVYQEEGAGDFIQFCRFIPRLRDTGVGKIVLTGPAPDLLEMVSDHIAVDDIKPLSGPLECDYVTGSMSFPWRLGLDYKDVSGKPYMKTEPARFPRRGRLNVGLVWRGNPAYGMDVHRSMLFRELCPLFDLNGAAFYSLQLGPAAAEIGHLGFDGFVADLAPFARSWRATARLIKRLDVVVTVDTAVAHLSGALGVPVLTMVTNACDWRWDRSNEKTVWYDSMRVYRQNDQDDWTPCIQRVRNRLMEMLDEPERNARNDARQGSCDDKPRASSGAVA